MSNKDGDSSETSTPAPVPAPVISIGHMSVKPPPFYRKSPETWFLQLESQFVLAKITSSSVKFHHVLAVLPEDIVAELSISSSTDYNQLKSTVIDHLRENKHTMIQQALSDVSLGDKRPSRFVHEIKRSFTDIGLTPDDAIIKTKLLSALPVQIRSALVGHDSVSLEQYAAIADSMLSVAQPSANTFYVGNVNQKYSQKLEASKKNFTCETILRESAPESV